MTRSKAKPLRLETLFVGGDDVCIIMPAFLAFDLAEMVLFTLRDSASKNADGLEVSFRGGLAIADSGTPFRRIKNLAYALMIDAKKAFAKDKEGNDIASEALSIAILEGVDLRDADSALDVLRGPHYLPDTHRSGTDVGEAFRFTLDSLRTSMIGMSALKAPESRLAKSVLHKLIEAVDTAASQGAAAQAFSEALTQHRLRGDNPISESDLRSALPGAADLPLSLRLKAAAEFWDYVNPLKEGKLDELAQTARLRDATCAILDRRD